jgi:hypothetical protein
VEAGVRRVLVGALLLLVGAPLLLYGYVQWREQKVLAFCERRSAPEPLGTVEARAAEAGLEILLPTEAHVGSASIGMSPALEALHYCCLEVAGGIVQRVSICSSG